MWGNLGFSGGTCGWRLRSFVSRSEVMLIVDGRFLGGWKSFYSSKNGEPPFRGGFRFLEDMQEIFD